MEPEFPPGTEIVITGGAGFIGSHLAREFAADHAVTVLDSLCAGRRDALPDGATFHQGDIRDEQTVTEVSADADIIFHEAARVSVAESVENPQETHAVNTTGTLNVLEAARRADARVVLASSAAMYGQPETVPLTEAAPKTPTSNYGLHKLTADHYARLYTDLYDLETVALRYFNVYGPGQQGGDYAGVIEVFLEQALRDDPITVHGDGTQTRDFVHVADVVDANRRAAVTDHVGEAYNVGTGTTVSIVDLAEIIKAATDSASEIVHTDARAGDIQHSQADISRIQSDLGYEPAWTLEAGIRDLVELQTD